MVHSKSVINCTESVQKLKMHTDGKKFSKNISLLASEVLSDAHCQNELEKGTALQSGRADYTAIATEIIGVHVRVSQQPVCSKV